jgi:hypothetical protein
MNEHNIPSDKLFYRNGYQPMIGAPLAENRTCNDTIANLYCLIEYLAYKKGYAHPTNEQLADWQVCSIKTVKNYLRLLKKAGWIRIDLYGNGPIKKRKGIYPLLTVDREARKIYLPDGTELKSDKRERIRKTEEPQTEENAYDYDDREKYEPTVEEREDAGEFDDENQQTGFIKEYRENHKREERDKSFMKASEDQQWAYIETLRKKGDLANANRYEEMLTGGAMVEPDSTPEKVEEPKEVAVSKPREATRELTTAEQCALQTKNIETDNYDRRNNVIDEDLYHKLKLEVIAESDAKKAEEEAKKQPEQPVVQQIEANTGNTNSAVATTTNSNIATTSPYGELATPMTGTRKNYNPAEKAFYEAAKSLGVTITNHNQARKWVKEVVRTRGLESAVNYFDFMRIAFPRWQYEFKPTVKTAYDLVTKAAQIEQLIQRQREEKARKIDYDNIDFYGDAK